MEGEIKLNLGCGSYRLDGFVNLDEKRGWSFQSGLGAYKSSSVDAITISHALMYLDDKELSEALVEAKRVLVDGGVIRITEDDTENPESDTYQTGWKNKAKSLTGPIMMEDALKKAGFIKVFHVTSYWSMYKDKSLMQNLHGGSPRCFFIEAIK